MSGGVGVFGHVWAMSLHKVQYLQSKLDLLVLALFCVHIKTVLGITIKHTLPRTSCVFFMCVLANLEVHKKVCQSFVLVIYV